jgi:hypothetical protein
MEGGIVGIEAGNSKSETRNQKKNRIRKSEIPTAYASFFGFWLVFFGFVSGF